MVENEFNEMEQMEELRRDKSSTGILWIVIIVVLIAIGALGGWWYFKHREMKREPAKAEAAVPKAADTVITEPENADKEEPVLTENQQAFNRYFTDSLLKDQLSLKDPGWDLSMFRKLVGNAFSAEFLTEMPGMTWEKWESTRKEVLQLARKVLADPDFLRWLWKRHSATVVTAVREAGKEGRVARWAERAEPYFSGALSMAHSTALNKYYEIDKQLEQELKKKDYDTDKIRQLTVQLDENYRKLAGNGLDREDIYLFEFSRRRLSEGGRDLLEAYADVLADLTRQLKAREEDNVEAGGADGGS